MTAVAGVQDEAAMRAIIMTAVKQALRQAVAFAPTLLLVEDALVVGGHIYLRVLAADSEGEYLHPGAAERAGHRGARRRHVTRVPAAS